MDSQSNYYGMPRPQTVSLEVKIMPENKPAIEIYFNLCLECLENLNVCACHERGYN